MSELACYLHWQVEKGHPWAWNVDAACDAFLRRTGQPATHCLVSPSAPAPPPQCPLLWRASLRVPAGVIQVGTEVMP